MQYISVGTACDFVLCILGIAAFAITLDGKKLRRSRSTTGGKAEENDDTESGYRDDSGARAEGRPRCRKCDTEFKSERLARFCESGSVPESYGLTKGTEVRVFTDDGSRRGWKRDVVISELVIPSYALDRNVHLDNSDEHIDYIMLRYSAAHARQIMTAGQYRHGDVEYPPIHHPDRVKLPDAKTTLDGDANNRLLKYPDYRE